MLKKVMEQGQIGSLAIRNRFVYPPITTGLATREGLVTEELLAYYRKRATDVGLVIAEPGVIAAEGILTFKSMGIYAEAQIEGLSKLAEAIKETGAKAFIQLVHVGPKGHLKINGQVPVSASPVEITRGQLPQEMSIAEIAAMKDKFVEAAARAAQAGFDGVELHGAHFYLLSAFLSPFTNQRTDQYGGSVQGRCLFVKEIIYAIKEKVGQAFPVIVRIHGAELLTPGISADEAVIIAQELAQAGADALHISSYDLPLPEGGYYTTPATPIPGPNDQAGIFVEHAARIKAAVDIPVIAVGKINSPELAEKIIAEGQADFVAIGRPLIVDPDLIYKWQTGQAGTECLLCNRCLASIGRRSISCAVNEQLY